MQAPIISIQELSKTYGTKTALNQISVDIFKGSVYGLIGQNGAGKTSLIRILNQIIDADSGNIMPPKTTWFEPKLRSGLVIHKLD